MSTSPDQLQHQPFPELADALRAQCEPITRAWTLALRAALPHVERLSFTELRDHVPLILPAIADALASDEPDRIDSLLAQSPKQGLTRFVQDYSVAEIMHEDRLLRATIVVHVERQMGRQMTPAEAAALHATVDVMLQQGVVALVDEQQARLRAAAEAELKYLSFLTHDLNNNLGSATLMLKLLRQQLGGPSMDCANAAATVDSALDAIHQTIEGMRRLLEHERLRKSGEGPHAEPVDLPALARAVVAQLQPQADRKGLALRVELAPAGAPATIRSDRELLRLALQNLLGNAVKYSAAGTVTIAIAPAGPPASPTDRWRLAVSDQGPGIAPDQLDTIFRAFRRGDVNGTKGVGLGTPGVGLGLAIASQAAKLLGAELTVESQLGAGSTFALSLAPLRPSPKRKRPRAAHPEVA